MHTQTPTYTHTHKQIHLHENIYLNGKYIRQFKKIFDSLDSRSYKNSYIYWKVAETVVIKIFTWKISVYEDSIKRWCIRLGFYDLSTFPSKLDAMWNKKNLQTIEYINKKSSCNY